MRFSLILPDAIHVRSHVAWQKSFEPPRQSPLTLHRAVVWRPLARRSSAVFRGRDERLKRQRSPKGQQYTLGSRLCAAQSRRQRQFQRFLFACTQIRPYCVGGALAHSNPWNGGLLIDDTLVAEMDVGELGVGVFEVRQRDLSGRPGRAAAGFGDAELDAVGHLDARAVLGAGHRVADRLAI
jgi:hypothetical protein